MKLAKLSLAAIMAAGALSTANAQSLEEAIKGVDISGHAYYRYQQPSGSEAYSKAELRVQLTTPVTEDVQLVTRATMDRQTDTNETVGSNPLNVDRIYMNYTGFKYTTVSLGRMYAGTPLDDTDAVGLKVVASPVKGLALAAAYYTDNSVVTNELEAVAAIYSNDMFNGRVWYVHGADEKKDDGADWIFVEGGANVGPVALKAQYAQKDPKATGAKTASTIRVQASGKMDAFGARVGYITNDKDAGDVTIDESAEGDNDLIYSGIYTLVQNNTADEHAYFGEVSGSFGKFSAKAGYIDYDNTPYDYQYYGQVNYQVSKNLATNVRYGSASPVASGVDDKTLARFQAQYNF